MSANTPIIKKVKKVSHAGHGGAWKIAYADFVTAMMAFFLLLWLLNAVSQEQLEGISDYFSPISTTRSTSGGGGLLGGMTVAKRGVFEVEESEPGQVIELQGPDDQPKGFKNGEDGALETRDPSRQELDEMLKQREQEQFRQAEEQIRQAIENTPRLQHLAGSLLIDNTAEGLRLQIIDQERLPMFPRGSAEMYLHTQKVLELIASVILQMPQNVAITGHTDATRYVTDTGYGNWELSADRANAARRMLIRFGVPETRFARVVGKAATDPLIPNDPEAHGNRRLSIVLLSGTGRDDSIERPAH